MADYSRQQTSSVSLVATALVRTLCASARTSAEGGVSPPRLTIDIGSVIDVRAAASRHTPGCCHHGQVSGTPRAFDMPGTHRRQHVRTIWRTLLVLVLCVGTTAAATLEAPPLTSTIIIATLDSLNAPPGDAHQMIPDPNPPPADYPTIGIIDNAAEQSSGAPGVLVPLAQAQQLVTHWLDAVDAAGPLTPLSDPAFQGTLFVPDNMAFVGAYPALADHSAAAVFEQVSRTTLAAQLNSLIILGEPLLLEQLTPGQLLRAADGGRLAVMDARSQDGALQLQHNPSGVMFSVLESDVQSGRAVVHVVDNIIPAAALVNVTVPQPGIGRFYSSAMDVLFDPRRQLSSFAGLVNNAGLTELLSDPSAELTLFAPSDAAVHSFLQSLSVAAKRMLAGNTSLVDVLVSAHLVAGVTLGSKALEALLPDGELKSQAGSLLIVQQTPRYPSSAQGVQSLERPTLPPGAVQQEAGQEAGSLVLPSGLLVDGAAVTALDVFGGKGVVHIIQRMLIPQQAAQLLQVPATSLQAPLNPSQLATGRPQTSSAVAARHAAGHVGAAGDAAGIVAGAVTAMLVLL